MAPTPNLLMRLVRVPRPAATPHAHPLRISPAPYAPCTCTSRREKRRQSTFLAAGCEPPVLLPEEVRGEGLDPRHVHAAPVVPHHQVARIRLRRRQEDRHLHLLGPLLHRHTVEKSADQPPSAYMGLLRREGCDGYNVHYTSKRSGPESHFNMKV